MGYRYLALINAERIDDVRAHEVDAELRKAGLRHRLATGPFQLFATPDTPTISLGDDGVLIGHVFTREGRCVDDETGLPVPSSSTALRKYLLEHCWGDYLLLQPCSADARGLSVTRDPSGGVLCFYALQNGIGFITSDVSLATSINLYRRQIDWEYITRCLTVPQQKAERTGLSGLTELLPGCTMRVASGDFGTASDWSPWDFVSQAQRHTDSQVAAADVREAVTLAVRAWAETDKSLLLEMSGGLDSSIVAACLRDTAARVVCCTLVTPVPGADERRYASLVAEALGVELQAEMLDFETVRYDFATPENSVAPRIGVLQYAVYQIMSARAASHNVASFFTGSGGDSVFCYLTNAAPAADAFKDRGLIAGISSIRDLCALHQCTLWTAGRLTLRKLLRAPKPPRSPHATFVAPSAVANTVEHHPWFDAPDDALPGDRERVFGLVDTQVYREMSPRGTDRWLRMPLLAQPVVEACLRTPSWMWIAGGRNRAVARAAFSNLLPTEILNRRSKGSFVSYLGSFYRRNREQISEFLLTGLLQDRRLLNADALHRFLGRDDLPTRDRRFLEIFDLCMIENWIRHQG